ncbi:MAG: Holliday junction resolvase RuvX [Gemmataceae bacterium]|nr:Holliday junction resolvase RuvX [Gemmataceae bacterium]
MERGVGSSWPTTGRLLGVDFGTVRVGLAVSDPDRIIASPLETLTRASEASDRTYFQRLVAAERVVGLVVGLPLHMSGDESQKSREARAFGGWLAGVTGLPVAFWDERHTSSMADDVMLAAGLKRDKRKARLDRVAAQFILQAYIEAGCQPAESTPTPQPSAGFD